jgi:hypothetical protein
MNKIVRVIINPIRTINKIYNSALLLLPDQIFLEVKFRQTMGKKLNLKNPQTYSEKLQWLKLYNRRPEYTTMVDKYSVKEYVANIIGKEYIIPTLGVWDRVEDIEWEKLPSQFVLKCTHDSGGLVICKDKSSLDKQAAINKLRRGLRQNYYRRNREWPYKNVVPRIIAEQYMEDEKTQELRDYKFFCFDGEVKALFIASERMKKGEETKFDFFDENFEHLPFTNGHPNADELPKKPICFEEMKLLAGKLSQGIPHVRVDFYDVNGKVYFGEMTFFHWSGFKPFEPEKWDYIFGNWIILPPKDRR